MNGTGAWSRLPQRRMKVPYSSATTGTKARGEIVNILRRFGCESVGFMDEFPSRTLLLAFTHRGRQVQLRASAQGWAKLYLRENPWTNRRRCTRPEWEERALEQGLIAINSILRDWVKGQVTAIETGILSFESVFLPYMLTESGDTLHDRVLAGDAQKLLSVPAGTRDSQT